MKQNKELKYDLAEAKSTVNKMSSLQQKYDEIFNAQSEKISILSSQIGKLQEQVLKQRNIIDAQIQGKEELKKLFPVADYLLNDDADNNYRKAA